ncbi:MAG: cytochrome P450 [Actinobacteria bacterium]|nr:cytochrome P450 [Actinomycetota bacterium]
MARRHPAADAPVDLSSADTFAAGFPHDAFARWRRESPVFWHEPTDRTPGGVGFWVVTRHADAATVMKDPVTFSSGVGGTTIGDSPGAGIMLNMTDDPQHRRLRHLVNAGFTPRAIGRLEQDLRRRAAAIVDAVPDDEPFDLVERVAQELPLQAICSILGVPQSQRLELLHIVDAAADSDTGEVFDPELVRVLSSHGARIIAEKRANPGDDILSVVVHAGGDDGEPPLTDRELRAFFNLLFPAGAETTRSAIAGAVLAFGEFPAEERRLRSDPSLLRTAVEEVVRWTSPSVYKRRTVTRDTVLGGCRLRTGDKVTYWELSANRDESVFADPFRFDVGRDPNPHLGFGVGVHFCLGASLARLEIRLMLEELFRRFATLEVVGSPTWSRNNRLVGVTSLPVIGRSHRPRR